MVGLHEVLSGSHGYFEALHLIQKLMKYVSARYGEHQHSDELVIS